MADKFINDVGLQVIKQWIEGKFALDADLDELAAEVSEIIAEGGEPNVIEVVKVNNSPLTPDANKAVNVEVPEDLADLTNTSADPYAKESDLPTKTSDLTNDGDGTTPFATTAAATTSAAGLMSAADKTKLDGVEAGAEENVQSDWNQTTTTADDFIKNKPTKLSDFTNDGDGTANSKYATEKYVDENGGKIDSISVNGTPQTIDENKNVDLDIPSEIFIAQNNQTTYTEIKEAYDARKQMYIVLSEDSKDIFPVIGNYVPFSSSMPIYLGCVNVDTSGMLKTYFICKISPDNSWSFDGVYEFAFTSDIPKDLSDLTNTGADPYAQMSDVESAVVGALKPKGSCAFASLPQLTAANLNSIYNITDAFTTTADFVEGAGKAYPAGTNVAIINTGTDANPVYKYDVYSSFIDLSAYWTSTSGQNNTLLAMTTAEINAILEPTTP